jgi:hypothetical protein
MEFDEPGRCLETIEYVVDSEMNDMEGLHQESFKQVPFTQCDDKRTNEPLQLNSSIALPFTINVPVLVSISVNVRTMN